MSKVTMLRTLVNNGWTIANRRAVISQIGKNNFDELATIAKKANMGGDVFTYQSAVENLTPSTFKSTKSFLSELVKASDDVVSTPTGNNTGTIYKKVKDSAGNITKEPIKVNIIPHRDNSEMVTYSFFDGKECVGDVMFLEKFHLTDGLGGCRAGGLLKDYPEYGIEGNRLLVHMLRNFNEQRYSGIGSLADKIAVEHCIKHGIEPNILSEASYSSHVAHYLRGKRFISSNGQDFNAKIAELIKGRKSGQRINTYDEVSAITYMPKEMVERIKQNLLEEPILQYKV